MHSRPNVLVGSVTYIFDGVWHGPSTSVKRLRGVTSGSKLPALKRQEGA